MNMCLSNGVINMAEYMLPEDVVPPETQLGITSSPCSVSALPLAWRNAHFTGSWSSSSMTQMEMSPGGFITLAGAVPVTGLSPECVTPL